MKILKNKLLLSGIIVLLIIVIPSFIFSIYQYSTINEEEKVIGDVYENQLESILFSVNQYSIDVVNNWTINLKEIWANNWQQLWEQFPSFIFVWGQTFCFPIFSNLGKSCSHFPTPKIHQIPDPEIRSV